ncbi:MAG: hypothetical protein QOF14_2257 [Hyphomicrobiales bacterium]|jgi:uncharacterized protein (DUF983 family)|nr:hypothetical protein [Hyphomicrobiales bacterium]
MQNNHSLIDADGTTHVKIAAVALVVSVVFMVVVSVSGLARWDSMMVHGPVVKATTTTTMATTGASAVR